MHRVMIVGGPGSGKSTLARQLGTATGLPVYHMDHLHWLPGWQPRPREDKIRMAQAIEKKDRWIFEGGMSSTYETRMRRADTLIWLDLPVGLRLWRVTKRMIRNRGQNRPDMAEGCIEGWHGETMAFYRFIWRTRRSGRARLEQLLRSAPAALKVHHLRRPSEIARYTQTMEAG